VALLCATQIPASLPACTLYIFNLLCMQIEMDGTPTDNDAWPTFEQLKGLLRCQPGRPISTKDIEADCITLLGTGV
jgi:hypothetical protein